MNEHGDDDGKLGHSAHDALDRLVAQLAREGAHRGADEDGAGPHPEAGLLVAHLRRQLGTEERRQLIAHLAGCSLCCDRLELASELLRVDALEGARHRPERAAAEPLDVGPSLMRVHIALERESLRVVETDAELRVAMGAPLRSRRVAPGGLAFRRALGEGGELRIELLEARSSGVSVCVALDGAPPGARVSRVVDGRIVETRPLLGGQAMLRELAVRTSWLRLEAPGRILGHVRLELTDARAEGGA